MLSQGRKEKNRNSLGELVRDTRRLRGLTQQGLGAEIGLEYYTMISQIELGYVSIPPSMWRSLPRALGLDVSEFALKCLKEYQPEVFEMMYHRRSPKEIAMLLEGLHNGDFDEYLKTKMEAEG